MHYPKVSVILPSIGRPSVYSALESIAKQSYGVHEILLISKKGIFSETIKNKLRHEFSNLQIFETENGKISENRNLGLEKATGNYIAFLDDDDFWLEKKIELQVGYMYENQIQICITDVAFLGEKLKSSKRPHIDRGVEVLRASYDFWWPFKKRPFIGFPTVLFNYELAKDIRFDLNLNEREDLWYLHDLQTKGLQIAHLDKATTVVSKSKPFSKRSFNVFQEYEFFMRLEKLEANLGLKFLVNTSLRNAIATGHFIGALRLLYTTYKSKKQRL